MDGFEVFHREDGAGANHFPPGPLIEPERTSNDHHWAVYGHTC